MTRMTRIVRAVRGYPFVLQIILWECELIVPCLRRRCWWQPESLPQALPSVCLLDRRQTPRQLLNPKLKQEL